MNPNKLDHHHLPPLPRTAISPLNSPPTLSKPRNSTLHRSPQPHPTLLSSLPLCKPPHAHPLRGPQSPLPSPAPTSQYNNHHHHNNNLLFNNNL